MKLRKCHGYTLDQQCRTCGQPTRPAHPARFSPEDRYGKYRRMLKRDGIERLKSARNP
ncbi:MAG TPA: RNA-protein complex protein Nop10 [Candidatus Bathyarchaeia archaeon]|nr:RNA-protein complex protein Nop10 [Candidatus Bathyarchaeia archaeon]